jgi:N-acetylmuramoyl-L-alanine amidase
MKTSYFSLTFIIAFLPALVPTFNTSFNQEGRSEKTLLNTSSTLIAHQHAHTCTYYHQNWSGEATTDAALPFGAELGKFIRESQAQDANYQIKTVVIDAGHGGKDPGCSGTDTKEKEIALSIALQLGRSLKQNFPNVNFIFTRQSDVFVPLDRRAKIANDNKADLFISIHCNYFPHSDRPRGSETYVLGLHRAKDNLEVAKRENAAIFYEENYQQTYDGYDPNSEEGHIILSMFQNAFLEQSISFANKIESNIKNYTQQRSRGVKQAGFLVLRKTTMPSVLVEAGYLSNGRDNQYLATPEGQSQMVNAIARAFSDYKTEVESGAGFTAPQPVYATTANQQSFTTKGPTEKIPVQKPSTQKPTVLKSPTPPVQESTPKANSVYKHSLIVPTQKKSNVPAAPPKPTIASSTNETADVQYKVVLAASDKLVDTNTSPWDKVPYSVQITKEGKTYRYMAIGFPNFEAAITAKRKLRQDGFNEAFLVAYQNGKRIDMAKAKAITGIK